jgi:hypothetical protein
MCELSSHALPAFCTRYRILKAPVAANTLLGLLSSIQREVVIVIVSGRIFERRGGSVSESAQKTHPPNKILECFDEKRIFQIQSPTLAVSVG